MKYSTDDAFLSENNYMILRSWCVSDVVCWTYVTLRMDRMQAMVSCRRYCSLGKGST